MLLVLVLDTRECGFQETMTAFKFEYQDLESSSLLRSKATQNLQGTGILSFPYRQQLVSIYICEYRRIHV